MNTNVKRSIPLPAEDLYGLLFRDQSSKEYSCFVDGRDISYNAIPRDCSGHAKLGKLVKL
jgi:hypothetical protein